MNPCILCVNILLSIDSGVLFMRSMYIIVSTRIVMVNSIIRSFSVVGKRVMWYVCIYNNIKKIV